MKTRGFRLPDEYWNKIGAAAEEDGLTHSGWLRRLLKMTFGKKKARVQTGEEMQAEHDAQDEYQKEAQHGR